MKRMFLKIVAVIAVAVALAAGVSRYLDSGDKNFGELVQNLANAAASLVESEESGEAGEISVVYADPEETDEEGMAGSEGEVAAGLDDGAAAEMTGSDGGITAGSEGEAAAGSEGEAAQQALEEEAASASDDGATGSQPVTGQVLSAPEEGKEEPPEAGTSSPEGESASSDAGSADAVEAGQASAGNDEASDENQKADGESASGGYQIENFEIIYQMPELPTGCEIVALTMVLHYYGYDVDKTTMASDYLPTAEATFYYGSDGLKYGPDLNAYFVGNPFGSGGYICGTEAIVTAADSYLEDVGSDLRAVDLTGASAEELYQLVSEGVPVVVWVTIGMAARASTSGWYTESGEYVEWSTNDHGAVLIGYTEDTVTIADPISGLIEYSREAFESVFASRGNQCVILTTFP